MKNITLSVIVPVYNEENYIEKTIQKIFSVEKNIKKEIIVVNDGSSDGTKLLLDRIKNKYNLHVYHHNANQGKGASLKTGILKSTGSVVLIQDADLEYTPEDYPTLLEPFLKQDADVVYGSRFISNKPHRVLYFWHSIGNAFLTLFSNMMTNLNLTDMETGYKVFKGDLIRKIAPKLETKKFGFEPEITARIAKIKDLKIYEVGISYRGRTYSEGKKIGWKDGIRAIIEIVKYNVID